MTQTEIPQEFDILGSSSKWKPENLKPVTLFEMSSASPQINELAAALAKAQAKFTPAAKNKTNPHLKSKYADLVAVTEACKAPLAEAGLSYSQIVESERAEVTCVTVLMHSSGQWIAGRLTLHGKDTSPQAMGSAITYARRYGLSAMLGIVTDEEDDGDSAQAQPAKSKDAKDTHAKDHGKDGKAKFMAQVWDGGMRAGAAENRDFCHPSQKPVELMTWCLRQLPRQAQTVADPFMGSGTTGVACAHLGLRFVGVELHREYFDVACERISRAQAQGQLLPPEQKPAAVQEALL